MFKDLILQRSDRNAVVLVEGRTAPRDALAIAAAGERRGAGLADLLQLQATSLDARLHEPNGF